MLNYTIRPVIWKHKQNTKGLCPIMIAITINRKVTHTKTPYKVLLKDWDDEARELKPSYANYRLHNNAIENQIAQLRAEVASRQIQNKMVTGKILKKTESALSFKKFAREIRIDQKEINRLENFSAGVLLSEIDVTFLRKYNAHEERRNMSQNTRNTTFKYLRRILTQAKAEGHIKDNPFENFSIPKYRQSDREYLTEPEREAIMNIQLPEPLNTIRWYFMLGCYSGLRHSDWLRFDYEKMVEDGYLKLRAKKNQNFVVVPVGPTLHKILENVRDLSPPLSNQKCNVYLKSIAMMAGVNKRVGTHTGRHSFGYLCASNKLPKSVTAELLGVNTQTVEVYYHLSGQNIIDQAAVLKTI